MTVQYRAWTFDAVAFHRWLDTRVVVEERYSPEQLREAAMEVASEASATVLEYLECLTLSRQDQESWDDTFHNPQADHEADWYAISLAGHLVPAPRLSMATYGRMQWLLPKAGLGWSAGRTDRLLNGLSLRWLVEDHGAECLHVSLGLQLRTVEVTTGSGGGWLPLWAVKRYRHWLDESLRGLPAADVSDLHEPLAEVTAMLDAAIAREAALRMILAL